MTFAALVGGGGAFFHYSEGWEIGDALYFCVITVSTVGFGDMEPVRWQSKLFNMFYIAVGTIIIFNQFIDLIASMQALAVQKMQLVFASRLQARDFDLARGLIDVVTPRFVCGSKFCEPILYYASRMAMWVLVFVVSQMVLALPYSYILNYRHAPDAIKSKSNATVEGTLNAAAAAVDTTITYFDAVYFRCARPPLFCARRPCTPRTPSLCPLARALRSSHVLDVHAPPSHVPFSSHPPPSSWITTSTVGYGVPAGWYSESLWILRPYIVVQLFVSISLLAGMLSHFSALYGARQAKLQQDRILSIELDVEVSHTIRLALQPRTARTHAHAHMYTRRHILYVSSALAVSSSTSSISINKMARSTSSNSSSACSPNWTWSTGTTSGP